MDRRERFLSELFLTVGFSVMSAAVVVAYLNPATGYEPSIYRATPLVFWFGFTVAVVIAAALAFNSQRRIVRTLSIGLAGYSFLAVVLLPSIRGWHQVLGSDSLSHRGTVLDLIEGVSSTTDVLYPLLHLLSTVIHHVTGIEPGQDFHLITSSFVLLYVVFVPLTVRSLSNDRWSVPLAAFSGMFLLSINHVSGHMHFQPASQTVLLLALVFYLMVRTVLSDDNRIAALLTLSLIAAVLAHPQQSANLLLLFFGFAVFQSMDSIDRSEDGSIITRPLYLQTGALLIAFWVWVQTVAPDRFGSNFARIISWLYVDTETAESVQTRTVSLEVLGGSIEEMFLKLFLASFIYCVFAGLFMAGSFTRVLNGRLEAIQRVGRIVRLSSERHNNVVVYWSAGFVVSSVMFFLYVFGGFSDQYFRHYAFLMVTVSIFGPLFLSQLAKSIPWGENSALIGRTATVLVLVFLLITVPIVFPSPYVYQGSDQIPEANIAGHELAFDHGDRTIPYASVRRSTARFTDAILGRQQTQIRSEGPTPDHFADRGLRGYYDRQTYLTVTEANRTDEADVYNGFRWSAADFRYLQNEPGIDRVQDNGGFELYLIHPEQ